MNKGKTLQLTMPEWQLSIRNVLQNGDGQIFFEKAWIITTLKLYKGKNTLAYYARVAITSKEYFIDQIWQFFRKPRLLQH